MALAMTARAQVATWRDSRALFERAVAVTRDNHVAHQNLGVVLLAAGEVQAGLGHLRTAARIKPRFLSPATGPGSRADRGGGARGRLLPHGAGGSARSLGGVAA